MKADDILNQWLELRTRGDEYELSVWLDTLSDSVRTDAGRKIEEFMRLRSTLSRPAKAFVKGRRIGRYELIEKLGAGAVGVVWKARDHDSDGCVALKVLYPHLSLFENVVARFEREAAAVRRLRHSGIVPLHDVGCHEELYYISYELVEPCQSLRESIDGLGPNPERLSEYFRWIARIHATLAGALSYAHGQGIIHRDVKPGNILIHDQGARLIDFGLAIDRELGSMTQTGVLLGTPRYMSPEQLCAGRIALDHRTDIYSLGACLFEAATFSRVFEGEERGALFRQILLDDVRDPREVSSEVPDALARICLRAMRRQPEERYPDMDAFAEDLDRFCHQREVLAREPNWSDRLESRIRREPRRVWVLTLVMLILIGCASTFAIWSTHRNANALEVETHQERVETRFDAYTSGIAEAASWLEQGEPVRAIHALERTPQEHRGWEWKHLQLAADNSLLVIHAHGEVVSGLTFSQNGRRMVTTGIDGTVSSWFVFDGLRQSTSNTELAQVRCLDLSDEDGLIAIGTDDGRVRLWNQESGRLEQECIALANPILDLRFLDEPSRLAIAGHSWLRLYDVKSKVVEKAFEDWSGPIEVSPGHGLVATSSPSRSLLLRDIRSGKVVRVFEPESSWIQSIAWSDDGSVLAVRDGQGKTSVRSARGETARDIGSTDGPLALSPTGDSIAMADPDGAVRVRSVFGDGPIRSLRGHSSEVTSLSFEPNGRFVAAGAEDGTVRVWRDLDAPPTNELSGHLASVECVAAHPGDKQFASGDRRGAIHLWDSASGIHLRTLHHESGWVSALAYQNDGHMLASAGRDGSVSLWDWRDGELISRLRESGVSVASLSFSPSGHRLGAALHDASVVVWDLNRRGSVTRLDLDSGAERAGCVSFTSDGTRIVAVGVRRPSLGGMSEQRSWLHVWTETGAPLGVLEIEGKVVSSLATDSLRGRLALGCRDGAIAIVDLDRLELEACWSAHSTSALSVTFHGDGNRLAVGHADGAIRILDVERGIVIATLRGHESAVTGVASCSKGRRLLSGSGDALVRVWESSSVEALPIWESRKRCGTVRPLLHQLFDEHVFAEPVVDELERSSLPRKLKELAVSLARARGDPTASDLNRDAWDRVRSSDGSRSDYEKALDRARHASRLRPGNSYIEHTLALALYRCGALDAARDVLDRADQLDRRSELGRSRPGTRATLAMILWRSGEHDSARRELDSARTLFERHGSSASSHRLLFEAETLIR